MLIQTRYPMHPLYQAALTHDYGNYVSDLLMERQNAGLPPFGFQVLLFAEARKVENALDFLRQAIDAIPEPEAVIINEPIPMAMMRIANVERAQLLIESTSRGRLQGMLKEWIPVLRNMKTGIRWHIEVDPMSI